MMSKISEIDEAVEAVKSTGNKNLILLHCNSSYPSTYSEVNLRFMDTIRKMYNIPVGFSDHTTDLPKVFIWFFRFLKILNSIL